MTSDGFLASSWMDDYEQEYMDSHFSAQELRKREGAAAPLAGTEGVINSDSEPSPAADPLTDFSPSKEAQLYALAITLNEAKANLALCAALMDKVLR